MPPFYKQDKMSLKFTFFFLGACIANPSVILAYLQSWSSIFPSASRALMGLTVQNEK